MGEGVQRMRDCIIYILGVLFLLVMAISLVANVIVLIMIGVYYPITILVALPLLLSYAFVKLRS